MYIISAQVQNNNTALHYKCDSKQRYRLWANSIGEARPSDFCFLVLQKV